MNREYIYTNIGKIVIIRGLDKDSYFKEIEEKLIPLTEDELKFTTSLLNNKRGYIYDSEKIDNLLEENDAIERKDDIKDLLYFLESIIPDASRTNYYRNLKNLTVNFNLDVDYTKLGSEPVKNITVATHNVKKNSIEIKPQAYKLNVAIARQMKNPGD